MVYNEMKGAYSSVTSLGDRHSKNLLFPDTFYRHDSFGDPSQITKLAFDQFVSFHGKFYHPTNAIIFVSGIGGGERNRFLDAVNVFLKEFRVDPTVKRDSSATWQTKSITTPIRARRPYASSDRDDKGGRLVLLTWLMNKEPLSRFEEMAISILQELLLGKSSSVLKKRLLESGLGKTVAGYGFEEGLLQQTFSIGLKDVREEDVEKVEDLLMTILGDLAKEDGDGFEEEDVAAAINTVEFLVSRVNV